MDNMNKFNVAVIEPVGGHGGMDYYDFGLCNGMRQLGGNIILYTSDETRSPDDIDFLVHKTFRKIYGKQVFFVRGIKFIIATVLVFWDVLYKQIPVVHFHFFDVGILQLGHVFLAKLLRRKIVITVHDVESFVEGKGSSIMSKLAYGWSDKLIVHNIYSQSELTSRLKIPLEQIEIIPSGNYEHVSSDSVDRISARTKLGWSQHDKIILFFGQIKNIKRLDLLLESLPGVVKECPEISLVIAGKEVDVPFATYQELIDTYGLKNRCNCFVRYIDNDEVPLFFAASDLVVLPYERIYQSAVLLMAMSFGRAVVVSDIPGMREVVSDGQTGYVFRNGEVSSLTECLITALKFDDQRNQIARNGLKLMEKEFAWSGIRKRHAELYMNVANASV